MPADFNSVVSEYQGWVPQIYDNEGKWDEELSVLKMSPVG